MRVGLYHLSASKWQTLSTTTVKEQVPWRRHLKSLLLWHLLGMICPMPRHALQPHRSYLIVVHKSAQWWRLWQISLAPLLFTLRWSLTKQPMLPRNLFGLYSKRHRQHHLQLWICWPRIMISIILYHQIILTPLKSFLQVSFCNALITPFRVTKHQQGCLVVVCQSYGLIKQTMQFQVDDPLPSSAKRLFLPLKHLPPSLRDFGNHPR